MKTVQGADGDRISGASKARRADARAVPARAVALTVPAPAVLENDTDPDVGDSLTTVLVSGPTHGGVTINSDGSLTYVPEAAFSGGDGFTYQRPILKGSCASYLDDPIAVLTAVEEERGLQVAEVVGRAGVLSGGGGQLQPVAAT